ncbi:hypothetical protein KR52_06915 [Synechococcus sp. KORDI-52]|nr:hypothetical protein KR52_06915 [Synechococcus sp. KORDI-52]
MIPIDVGVTTSHEVLPHIDVINIELGHSSTIAVDRHALDENLFPDNVLA